MSDGCGSSRCYPLVYACALLSVTYLCASILPIYSFDATESSPPPAPIATESSTSNRALHTPARKLRQTIGAATGRFASKGQPSGRRNGKRNGARGRGRHSSFALPDGAATLPREPIVGTAAAGNGAACESSDDTLRLRGTGCALSGKGCGERYVLLRMAGNDKYLAPREHGVVYAAVRRRFRSEGSVPLARIAWRVVPMRNGWVQFQHVLTGRYLRIVPPPDPVQWLIRAELDPSAHGKRTWFRIEGPGGESLDMRSRRPKEGHLRAHATGAYVNYRVEDMIRGHGNQMVRGQWVASPRQASTRLFVEGLDADALAADAAKWAAARAACFAPCVNATAAAMATRSGGIGWSDVCWKHYAEPTCSAMLQVHGPRMGGEAGAANHLLRARWARLDCDKYVERPPGGPVTVHLAGPAAASEGEGAPALHCSPLVDGVLLLLVSDRPNQFLCHYFESALLHGLRPTVLGWDAKSWAGTKPKPWTYHLGAKLVLPQQYLDRCNYPDDALVLFTDHDVVFQGGYAELRAAYTRARAAAKDAPILFSAESESYPLELKPMYPRTPTDPTTGPHEYLNSGMWIGTVGAAKALLRVMSGVHRGESMATLLRHYHHWGTLDTKRDPIPAAYTENDQVKYAGLYVAQEIAAACADGRRYSSRGGGCFKFLHDGQRRCAPGCSARAASTRLPVPRIGAKLATRSFALESRACTSYVRTRNPS